MKEEQKGEILIYQSEEGSAKIQIRLENEDATCKDFLQVQTEGSRKVERKRQ